MLTKFKKEKKKEAKKKRKKLLLRLHFNMSQLVYKPSLSKNGNRNVYKKRGLLINFGEKFNNQITL